jgi:AmmeMemoRadiSam system protein A
MVNTVTNPYSELPNLARRSIESHWSSEIEPKRDLGLNEPAASFVTLTKAGQLRGCIGSLQAHRSLWEDVVHNARAAAFHDPRFPPLELSELAEVNIEVSVLTAPELVRFDSETELFQTIRPGIDGVVIESQGRRATFLPQVWEQLPTQAAFFRQLLIKAGLNERTPLTEVSVSRYQVNKVS